MMTSAEVAKRARTMIGQGRYKLGAGNYSSKYPESPFNSKNECDCSGFVAWCLQMNRKTNHPFYAKYNGGWLETTAVERDVRALGVGMFQRVTRAVRPGDIMVWGDRGGRQGHIGIVSRPSHQGAVLVIHCSAGNMRRFGYAVAETNADVFIANNALIGRYAGLV